ncbi:MAG: ComEC/Rec2 family competence protein [Phycisphaerae bacterium]
MASWSQAVRRAPLVVPAVALMVGIALDAMLAPPVAVPLALAAITLGGMTRPGLRRRGLLPAVGLLACSAGSVLHHRTFYRVPADHIVRHMPGDGTRIGRVRGQVATPPRIRPKAEGLFGPWMYSPDSTAFVLEAGAIQVGQVFQKVSGKVRVNVKEAVLDLAAGDRIELFGRLYRPSPPVNPGAFDWSAWQRRRGVRVGLSCQQIESVTHLDNSDGGGLHGRLASWRSRLRGLVLDDMLAVGGPETSLLDAMLLARRSEIDPKLNEAFVRIGCAHYLAASGFHVGMLALFLYAVGRMLGVSRRTMAVFVALATVGYAVLAEPRPPILRATILAVAVCTSLWMGRRASPMSLLALAALANLIWKPTDLFDVGFQMSYACMVGLILLQPVLQAGLGTVLGGRQGQLAAELTTDGPGPGVWRWSWWRAGRGWITASVTLFLAACIPSWPIIMMVFQRFSPWAWFNTLVVFVPVALVMCVGFFLLLLAVVSPALAIWASPALKVPTAALLGIVDVLGRVPGVALYVLPPPWIWVICYYGVLLALIAWHRRMLGRWAVIVLSCGLAVATIAWFVPARPSGRLTMTVLSVGRGTSTVIELPDGSTLLYDAGGSGSFDPGVAIIGPFLIHRRIRHIQFAIISHPNLDHFNGLPAVADRARIGEVMVSPQFERLSGPNRPSRRLLDDLHRRNVPIRTVAANGEPMQLGGARVEILWPPPDGALDLDSNESSLVLRIEWEGKRILLTGDIEEAAQEHLLSSGVDLSADVLMLPHHGAMVSNTLQFIEAVDPTILIQSGWRGTEERRAKLLPVLAGRRFWNTGDDGAVEVVLDKGQMLVTGFSRRDRDSDGRE